MNTQDRIKRVRELLPESDPHPWAVSHRGLMDAGFNTILVSARFDEKLGVLPSNDVNAEIIEHLSHLAFVDFEPGEIAQLQQDIHDQANRLFPKRTPSKAWLKLYEEMGEVIKDPNNPDEWGDVFILLFDLAKIHGIDIRVAVEQKMEILDGRTWVETPTGTYQHVPAYHAGEHVQPLRVVINDSPAISSESMAWPTLQQDDTRDGLL